MQECLSHRNIEIFPAIAIILAVFGFSILFSYFGEDIPGIAGQVAISDWHHSLEVNVSTERYPRTDYILEIDLNLSKELAGKALDTNSIRVYETDASGNPGLEVMSQFEPGKGFDSATNALGKVVFVMRGTTNANTVKRYKVFFDSTESPKPAPSYQGLTFSSANNKYTVNLGDSTVIRLSNGQPESALISGREQIYNIRIFNDVGVFTPVVRASGPVRIIIDWTLGGKKVTDTAYFKGPLKISDMIGLTEYKYMEFSAGGDPLDGDELWKNTTGSSWTFGSAQGNSGHTTQGWFSLWDAEAKDSVGCLLIDKGIPEPEFHTLSNYNGYDLVYMWQSNVNGAEYTFSFKNYATALLSAQAMDSSASSSTHPAKITTKSFKAQTFKHPILFFTAEDIPTLKAKTTNTNKGNLGVSPSEVWQKIKARADTYATEANPAYDEYDMRDEEDRLLTLSFAYLMTDDKRYLSPAKSSVTTLLGWQTWEGSYYFGHKSICRGVAYAYDMLYSSWTEDERFKIKEALTNRCVNPLYIDAKDGQGYFSIDNAKRNNNFHVNYVGGFLIPALALSTESPNSGEWIATGKTLVQNILDNIDQNGGWREGLQYGTTSIDWLLPSVYGLKLAGTDLSKHERLKSLQLFPIYQMIPTRDGNAGFGEVLYSNVHAFPFLANFLSSSNQISAQVISEFGTGDNVLDFIWLNPTAQKKGFETLELSRNFKDLSWQFLRSGWTRHDVLLGIKDDYMDVNHGSQNDCNNFIINAAGDYLASDQGKHLGETAGFKANTLGHNTLIIDNDEKSQKLYLGSPHCYNDLYFGSDFLDYVIGDATEAYHENGKPELSKFERHFLFVKPDYLVIFDDIATDGTARQMKNLYHLKGSVDPISKRFSRNGNKIALLSEGYRSGAVYHVLEPADFTFNTVDSWSGISIENDPVTGPYMEIGQNGAKTAAKFLSVIDIKTTPSIDKVSIEKSLGGSGILLAGDLDRDGTSEIAFNQNGLKILNYRSSYETINVGDTCTGPKIAIGNLDTDQYPEIICPVYDTNEINIAGYNGASYSHEATITPGRMIAKGIVAKDIDSDGRDEIITGDSSGVIKIIDFNNGYSVSKQAPIGGTINDLDAIDMDSDGKIEIVAAVDGKIRVYDSSFTLKAETTASCDNIEAGNLDPDSRIEIACDENIYEYNSKTFTLQGKINGHGLSNIELYDLDKAGKPEIIKAGSQSTWSMVEIFDYGYGNFRQELSDQTFGESYSGLSAGDVDGDGMSEIIIGSSAEGKILILGITGGGDLPNEEETFTATRLSGTNSIGALIEMQGKSDVVLFNLGTGSISSNSLSCQGRQCMARSNLQLFSLSDGTLASFLGQTLFSFSGKASGSARVQGTTTTAKISSGQSITANIYSKSAPTTVRKNGGTAQYTYANSLVTINGLSGDNTITIEAGTTTDNPPYFSPILQDMTAYEGQLFSYDLNAFDEEGAQVTWSDNSDLFEITPEGTISFIPALPGIHNIEITISDGANPVKGTFRLEIMDTNDPPLPPILLSPVNNTAMTGRLVTLSWIGGTDADPGDSLFHRLSVRTSDRTVFNQVVDSENYSIDLADKTRYYWFVEATDSKGISQRSKEYTFMIDSGYLGPECGDGLCDPSEDCLTCFGDCGECPNHPPSKPILSSPSNGASLNTYRPSFSFTGSSDIDGDTLSYRLTLTKGENSIFDSAIQTNPFTLPNDLADGMYVWKITASDGIENIGSDERSFTISHYTDSLFCGDGTCSAQESCSTCTADCGECRKEIAAAEERAQYSTVTGLLVTLADGSKSPLVEVKVEKQALIPVPEKTVYNFIELVSSNFENDEVRGVRFNFNVNRRWMATNNIKTSDVKLMRLEGENWEEIEARFVTQNTRQATYSVETDRIGNFAVVVDEQKELATKRRERQDFAAAAKSTRKRVETPTPEPETSPPAPESSSFRTIIRYSVYGITSVLVFILIVPLILMMKKRNRPDWYYKF